jgi:hypothetical protein
MNRLRRITGLVLTAALGWGLAGCSGKSLKYEDLKRVQPNMSQAEIEEILGRGSASTDEEIGKASQHGGPRSGGQVTYKSWKDSKTLIVLGFQNDRVVQSYFTTTDTELSEQLRKDREAKRDAQRAERGAPPPDRRGAPQGDDNPPDGRMPSRDDAMRQHRLTTLTGQLKTYAVTHQDRLPKDLKELQNWGNWSVFLPEVQQALQTGEYVVAWGLKIGKFDSDTVIAWEKDAPEQGGYAGKSNGFAEKMTPAQIQARWPKK